MEMEQKLSNYLANRLQEIKEQEKAIKNQKDFIRDSLIASIKDVRVPSVKKVGTVLNVIAYKDLENWDVNGAILEHFLCTYIEQNPLCVALKVIERLEDGLAKGKTINFNLWIKEDTFYCKMMIPRNFSVPVHFAKSILESFYKKLKANDISAV
jgi:hypothetical protein